MQNMVGANAFGCRHDISPLCPPFFLNSMYSTIQLRPAMSHEIQRCVPL